jgi:hypothetical protein
MQARLSAMTGAAVCAAAHHTCLKPSKLEPARPCCDTKHATRFRTSASKPRSIRSLHRPSEGPLGR